MTTTRPKSLLGEPEPASHLEADWGRVARIWWALIWRSIFAVVGAGVLGGGLAFVTALFLGMLAVALDLSPGTVDRTSQIFAGTLGTVLILVSSLLAVRSVIGKQFHGFRIVLLETK